MPLQPPISNNVYPGKTASASNYNIVLDNCDEVHNNLQTANQTNAQQSEFFSRLNYTHSSLENRLAFISNSTQYSSRDGGVWQSSGPFSPVSGPFLFDDWDTEVVPPSGIELDSTGTVFTILHAGLWHIDCSLQITNLTPPNGYYLYLNSVDEAFTKCGGQMTANALFVTKRFNAGDIFTLNGFVDASGSDPPFETVDLPPTLRANRLGA